MGKFLLAIGLLGLCHAAFSATQHRNYLRLIESEFTALPGDILVETLLSLLACCIGIITLKTNFKPIRITSEWEHKTWDNVASRVSFYSFNHRGKLLFSSASHASAASLTRDYLNQTRNKLLSDNEKRAKQNELIRQRLAEAYKEDDSATNSSSASSEQATDAEDSN